MKRENKLHTPVGVRDLLTAECAKKAALEKGLRIVFRRYGYEQVESPMFEYIEVFSEEKRGSTSPLEMYQFFDRDGSTLALRSDMTPPIARIAATAYQEESGPMRFSYFGNSFRISGDYQGKLREHPQAGIELMGKNSIEADAEAITVAVRSLLAAGLKEFKITIGQVSFFKAILEETGLGDEIQKALMDAVAKRDYVAAEWIVKENPMPEKSRRLFLELPKLVGEISVLRHAAELTESQKALGALKELGKLYTLLSHYRISRYVTFDLGMVNKLNYYTGIIFRGYTYGCGYAVVNGGRYDRLVEQFGRELPAVGFGLKLDGILQALCRQGIEIPVEETEGLVCYTGAGLRKAIAIAEEYRESGRLMEMSLLGGDLEENLAYAKKKNFSHVLYFLDDKRVKVISLKDEMGGFTVDMAVDELQLPENGGDA